MKRVLAAALAAATVVVLSACTAVPTGPGAAVNLGGDLPDKPVSGGVVYLVRGGLNVFSTGMDEVAAKLKAKGIDAKSVPHADWQNVDMVLRQRYAAEHLPIVLVGHSFGADAEIVMATDLRDSNIPIPLMILYDVTNSVKVPGNVRHVIYIASSTVKNTGITVTGEADFTGNIEIIEVPEGHLDMDNAARIQDATVDAILKVIKPTATAAVSQ
jgi:pimeloyl-ACP methyl ester carboxylesterase